MSKFSDKFVDGMSLVAEKVDENKFLGAIKDSFTIYMPFVIVGSFMNLFNTIAASMRLARRHILSRRRWIVAVAIIAIPAFMAFMASRRIPEQRAEVYTLLIFLMIGGILVPYLAAFLGSSIVGDEIEGRTLVYVWTRPHGRHTVFLWEYLFVALWIALVAAITQQTPKLVAKGPDYCPYPATWLNGERWNDELPADRAAVERDDSWISKPAPDWMHDAELVERLIEEANNRG